MFLVITNFLELFRLYNPLPSPQAQGNHLTLEETFQGAKI